MSERCPTCGQVMPERGSGTDPDLLLWLLKEKPRRMVYRNTHTGRWLVSCRTGSEPEFTDAAVRDLTVRGEIHSCYSNCPDDAYWLHPTVDVDALRWSKQRKRQKRQAVTR